MSSRHIAGALILALASLADTARAEIEERVGRLRLSDEGYCVATLVAPGIAVTAAHCLVGHADVRFRKLDDVTVTFRGGRKAKATQVLVHASFPVNAEESVSSLSADLAVISLPRAGASAPEQPLPLAGAPIVSEVLHLVTPLGDGASSRTCEVMRVVGALFEMNCPIGSGDSGAPVLRHTGPGAEPALVGIVSATLGSGERSIGVRVDRDLPGMIAMLDGRP